MHRNRIVTTIHENTALARARKARAQQLVRRAHKITRRRLTPEDRKALAIVNELKNGPDLTDLEREAKRRGRKLRGPNHRVDSRVDANELRARAQMLQQAGHIGRRYLHLLWNFLKGNTYDEAERGGDPEKHGPRPGNEPRVDLILKAVRKTWGLLSTEVPQRHELSAWLEYGNLTRDQIAEKIKAFEAA